LKASCNFVGINYGKMTDDRQGGEFITCGPQKQEESTAGEALGWDRRQKKAGESRDKDFPVFLG
jgi:hypothetical protein